MEQPKEKDTSLDKGIEPMNWSLGLEVLGLIQKIWVIEKEPTATGMSHGHHGAAGSYGRSGHHALAASGHHGGWR